MRRKWVIVATVLVCAAAMPLASADHAPAESPIPIAFDHRGGNEWWVEVRVTTTDEVSGVFARTESGTYKALTLRSWGNWAGSIHVPPGERVQFQAYRAGGMSDAWRVSSCYFTHPAGEEQCGDAPNRFAASFRPSGNEWWEQVYVDANMPVGSVTLVRYTFEGEKWSPLTLRSWGAWAGSYHAPAGTIVKFVATAGEESVESSCYRWPDRTVVACPYEEPPSGRGAQTYDHKTGNEWWVEVRVGPETPLRVQAQDEGGQWVELAWRSWGAWAGSFHIEPGNKVRFQALFEGDTLWDQSCWFTHPQGLSPQGTQTCQSV